MLCYPSHSTHIYQGLNVVIFSVLKCAWSNEWDCFEACGPAVTKLNFMAPSLMTSTTSLLPPSLASPVHEVVNLISHHNAQKCKHQETTDLEEHEEQRPVAMAGLPSRLPYTPV